MTNVRYGVIKCNGCGAEGRLFRAQYHDDPGAQAERARLRRQKGWRRVPGGRWGGKDFCGICAAQHPEAK